MAKYLDLNGLGIIAGRFKELQPGKDGQDGATFTPAVSADGTLSWTNDKSLPNPDPVNIRGPRGYTGSTGPTGPQGEQGLPGPAWNFYYAKDTQDLLYHIKMEYEGGIPYFGMTYSDLWQQYPTGCVVPPKFILYNGMQDNEGGIENSNIDFIRFLYENSNYTTPDFENEHFLRGTVRVDYFPILPPGGGDTAVVSCWIDVHLFRMYDTGLGGYCHANYDLWYAQNEDCYNIQEDTAELVVRFFMDNDNLMLWSIWKNHYDLVFEPDGDPCPMP